MNMPLNIFMYFIFASFSVVVMMICLIYSLIKTHKDFPKQKKSLTEGSVAHQIKPKDFGNIKPSKPWPRI